MHAISLRRRQVLLYTAGAGAALVAGCAADSPRETMDRAHAPADTDAIATRVDRITWGANEADVEAARRVGFSRYLDGQLKVPANASLPLELQERIDRMAISGTPMPALVTRMEQQRKAADAVVDDEAKKAAQQAYQQQMNQLAREASSRHLLRALYSPHQVLERMTWFWLNHFSVHQYKANLRAMVADYDDTIRRGALGRFRDLLGAVAHHPAMLRYLDNEQNAAGHVNENYARELMELHTLGVDAGYTQADVQELARVLTGVGVNVSGSEPRVRRELQPLYVRDGLFEFNPNRHDFGPKRLLGQPIAARGLAELDEALDRLCGHPAAATFICRKLAVYWMADDPPPALVTAMAQTFRETDGHIARVLQVLFKADAFWRVHKFKDPMRYVLSAIRSAYDRRAILNTQPVLGWLGRLGEPLYGRATPDGYPLESRAWSGAGQMASRFEIARAIGSGSAGLFRPDEPGARDVPAFPQLASPLFYEWREKTLGASTRAALGQAASPQEWNTFLLASPEFMEG